MMTQEEITHTHNEIKQSYRLFMNGVTAQSLRDKGMDYHLNWGVSIIHLLEMAKEYKPDYDLAKALWNDDIRESKILATMLMPIEQFHEEEAFEWAVQTKSQEIAEIASKFLYSRLTYAKVLAFRLIGQEEWMTQLQGYNIIAGLFSSSVAFTEQEKLFFREKADTALQSNNISLKHCVMNALIRQNNQTTKQPNN